MVAKVPAENTPYRLKPFASTLRKTGLPNVTDCCFEVAQRCAPLPGVSITAWTGSSGSAPALGHGFVAIP